mgnify:CR=1 FL=1
MPQQVFFVEPVELSARSGVLRVTPPDRGAFALPPAQTGELFALSGARADPEALALLDRQSIPLHCFRQGILERSFLPSEGIVFGRIPLVQIQTFLDPHRVLLLRREWFRGCIRLRCLAVRRRLPPARRTFWEGAYEDLLVPAYRGDPPALEEMRRRLEEYDRLRRAAVEDPGRSERLRHWCRAICLGVFSRLALDPWLGILPRPQGGTPDLAEDLALLMEPLFVDVPPPARLRGERDWARFFKRRGRTVVASDGGRPWSLRTLPLREGYHLIAHCLERQRYRAALRLDLPPSMEDLEEELA